MIVFPLSIQESAVLRWAVRCVPITAAAVTLLLGAISVASAQM